MISKLLVLAASAAILAGCATVPTASTDQWSGFGEATRAGRVVVEPRELIEDSRCPMNARCVWAGRVTIDTTVWVDRQKYPVKLTLGEPYPIAGGQLILDSVMPPRETQQGEIPREDYRFHFDFQ